MRASALLPLLLAALALFAAAPAPASAQSGAGWQLYSFCYFTQNTLATSPYLPWSMYAQGTMNVSTASSLGSYRFSVSQNVFSVSNSSGYQVYGITGFREVYAQGQALRTNQIVGVTAVGQYGGNDNLIQLSAPYFTTPHALSFYLDGVAPFAAGPAVYPSALTGTRNVSLNGFAEYGGATGGATATVSESDNPPNDGQTNVIVSGFQLATAIGGFVNSYSGCTLTRPSAPSIPAATLTAYQTSVTWPFCYQFDSGANNVGNALYVTTTSGVITTAGYQGVSPTNTSTGYLAKAVSGTRTFSVQYNYPGDLVSTTNFVAALQAIGSPLSPFASFPQEAQYYTSGLFPYTNNVLYPAFPNFDLYGIAFILNSSVPEEFSYTVSASSANGTRSDTQIFVMYTDSGYLIYDIAYTLRYANFSRYGNFGVLPYVYGDLGFADTLTVQTQAQFAATGLTQASWTTAVCGNDYSVSPTKYSFCYYVDNSHPNISAADRGVVSVYGVFTAKTGLTRYGRPAMQLQSMSGVRTVVNSMTNTATSQSLISLAPPNGFYEQFLTELPGYYLFWLTDNVLFTAAPWFSEAGLGLTFATITSLTFPSSQVTPSPFMNIFSTWNTGAAATSALLEEAAVGDAGFPQDNLYGGLTVSGFSYTPFVAGQVATCNALDNKVSQATQAYSFCWFRQSAAGYINMYQAVIYAYTTPIYRNSRPGYVIQTMVGTRTFVDASGIINQAQIAGVSGDFSAEALGGFNALFSNGFSNAYDNLIYDSFPYLDSQGLLYQVVGPLGQFEEASINDTVNFPGLTGFSTGNGIAVSPFGRLWYDENNVQQTNPINYYDETLFNITDLFNSSTGAFAGALWYYELLTGPAANIKLLKDGGAAAQNTSAYFLGNSCNAPLYQTFSFCYTIQNTQANSPYLQWAVSVSGTLNISMQNTQFWLGNPGYTIVNATGTRTIQYGGQTVTNRILGVAPQLSFNWNDNKLNLFAPFITDIHAITFVLDGVANFAGGPIPELAGFVNSTYVTIANWTGETSSGAGLQEVDQPINDGSISVITSGFDMRLYLASANYQCPYTVPTISWPSSALTSYRATQQVAMCFSVSIGPGGYGTLTSGFATVITTLVLTTTSFGQTATGTPAYLITAATGQRVYIAPAGSNITVNVVLAGLNAGMHAFPNDYFARDVPSISLLASDNVYYPQFAQLDTYGISLRANRDIVIAQDADTHSTVARVSWSGANWQEQDIDGASVPGSVLIYGSTAATRCSLRTRGKTSAPPAPSPSSASSPMARR